MEVARPLSVPPPPFCTLMVAAAGLVPPTLLETDCDAAESTREAGAEAEATVSVTVTALPVTPATVELIVTVPA